MQLLAHKNIKKFTEDIFVKEPEQVESARNNLVNMMYEDMREGGHLPCLDMMNYTTTRDHKTGMFKVVVSVYGVFVGREKACRLEGVEILNSGRVYNSEYRATETNS